MRITQSTIELPYPHLVIGRDALPHRQIEALTAQLRAATAREDALIRVRDDLAQRQEMLTQEFEHRLINGLVSLLSLQSRAATTPEAANQLTIASRRVAALGRVHRRLHLLDNEESVELKKYLHHLCEDLSGLLFQEGTGYAIVVEGAEVEIPTVSAIPLGFIVNELITNSAKYANGNITIRVATTSQGHSLTVLDDGPGLPPGFDPAESTGLGMKIVLSLVKKIEGELHVLCGDQGHGARFTVTFPTVSEPAQVRFLPR